MTSQLPTEASGHSSETSCENPDSVAAWHSELELDRLLKEWQSLRDGLTAIDRAIKAVFGNKDFSPTHWMVMIRLRRHGAMKQSELRQHTGVDSGFLTRVLDDLDAHRFVQRVRDTVDRRQVQLQITSIGCAAMRMAYRTAAEGIAAAPRSEEPA